MTKDLKGSGILDADGDILTRAGGEPSGISRASLASDGAFTGKYVDLAAVASRTRREAFDLDTDASGGVAGIFVTNQGDGRYGIAITPNGSDYNAFYINYSHTDDADYGIGIDVGSNAVGGLLIDCDGTATAIRVSGTSSTLVEWKNGGGTSKGRVNTSSNLVEFASNMGMRWYSDGYSTTVAEVKVDGTDAGLGNFFNRGIRTRTTSGAPANGYSGELAVDAGRLWAHDGTSWKSVSLAAPQEWLRPQDMAAVIGSPALTTTNRWPAYAFDSAAAELTSVTWLVPTGWSTVHVDFYWTNLGAGSGDVVWRCDLGSAGDGETLSSPSDGTPVTATAPAQNVLEVTRMLTSAAVTAGEMALIDVVRLGADGADTLGNDAGVTGVAITRAS